MAAHPRIVSRDEWLAARKELLAKEKALTRQRDALNAERRQLPVVEVTKEYVFEGPQGRAHLIDLFEGRSQLIVYHFMFDPDPPPPDKSGNPWEEGCPGCSHIADNLPHLSHIHARDTSLVMVSRARLEKIIPFKRRMGWTMPWYSSFGSDFNHDFHVTADESVRPVEYNFMSKQELAQRGEDYFLAGELPGLSTFLRDGGRIFHTYSSYSRGLDQLLNTYNFLDLTLLGRQEAWEKSPEGWPQTEAFWLRHHDKYEEEKPATSCCHD